MGLKVNFEIEDHIIILVVMIFLIALVTGGLPGFIEYLQNPKSILAIHGTLITGLIALAVGFMTVNAVRSQINSEIRNREQEKISNEHARQMAAVLYLASLNLLIKEIDEVELSENIQGGVGRFVKQSLWSKLRIGPPSILTDWESIANLPLESAENYINVLSTANFIASKISGVAHIDYADYIIISDADWIDLRKSLLHAIYTIQGNVRAHITDAPEL